MNNNKIQGWSDEVEFDKRMIGVYEDDRFAGMPVTIVRHVGLEEHEQVYTASEVKALLNEIDSAITIKLEDGSYDGTWSKAVACVHEVAERNNLKFRNP